MVRYLISAPVSIYIYIYKSVPVYNCNFFFR